MKINIRHLINYDDVISYKIPEDNNEYIASVRVGRKSPFRVRQN